MNAQISTGGTLDEARESRVRKAFDGQGMMKTLRAQLTRVSAGEVEIVLPFAPHIAQHHGFVHAGGLTTVVDNAGGFASMTLMPLGMEVLTIEFKVNFLSPAIGERFIATGRVRRVGKQIYVVDGEVEAEDKDGRRKTIAIMLATMMGVWLNGEPQAARVSLSELLHSDLIWLVPALAFAGVVTGVLAGLFGVGGGAIIVPVLYQTLRFAGVPDAIAMPVSVGTSLAVIVPTSINSARGHFAKGAVDIETLKTWALPVLIGVLVGAGVARYAPAALFKLVFVGISAFTAVRMLGGYTHWRLGDEQPRGPRAWAWAGGVGLSSSLMGVGGGQLVNLYMSLYGAPMHLAVGTAAGVGALVSAPGALGFILAGWGKHGLPPGSLGFVSLIGFVLIAPTATLAAPYGVRLAHAWPKRKLELAFGWFLIAIIARFIVSLIFQI